jgi:hypothetical protein
MIDYDFERQTDIGRRFGVSSHVCGKWLAALGLRIVGGDPTDKARTLGLVKSVSIERGNYERPYFIWHVAKTLKLLEAAGHRQAQLPLQRAPYEHGKVPLELR